MYVALHLKVDIHHLSQHLYRCRVTGNALIQRIIMLLVTNLLGEKYNDQIRLQLLLATQVGFSTEDG